AEETLRFSEERYRLLVESVKDYAIFMLDPNGFITTWNVGARRLKGYSEKEIIGKHFSIFYPQEAKDRKYPERILEEAARLGRYEDEGIRVRKDGSTFFANVVITPLYNSDNKLIGFSKITRDLTLKKEMEQHLQEINVQLEKKVEERTEELSESLTSLKKINADLDSFIYTASHDLKAPVSNIEGLINTLNQILLENNISKKEIGEVISMMRQSVNKFQTTIHDLAEINSSQKNDTEEKVTLNIAEQVENVRISILNLIQSAHATIHVDTSLCPEINFSRMQMNSLIYNVITNAIKYKAPDRDPVIWIKTYTAKAYSVIEVKDNGMGIKLEDKDKIFSMFKRLHDHVEGTGVGLYIVKRIVDNAGGKIEVESKLGLETIFRIYIPLA
ncbi:MAG: sensor histidine kinase, partial [Cytophagaceae bacterium]